MAKNDLGNYIHNCDSKRVKVEHHMVSLFDIFNDKELIEIYSFYLNDWHSNEIKNKTGKSFNDYGWKGMDGNKGLNKLEGLLLAKAEIQTFCMMKTDSINDTLKNMNLDNNICVCHPRAVIKMKCKVKYTEDFQFKIITNETRLECLFRHIRNALAHNMTYFFDKKYLLLADKEDEIITARILLKKETLLEWKKIIVNGKNSN